MSNMLIVTTSKEGQEKVTVVILDKIQAFQKDGDRLNIFVDGTIFSVCQDLDNVWGLLVGHFSQK